MEIMKKETIFLQLESMNNKGLSFLFTPSFDCRDAATVERTLSGNVGWLGRQLNCSHFVFQNFEFFFLAIQTGFWQLSTRRGNSQLFQVCPIFLKKGLP